MSEPEDIMEFPCLFPIKAMGLASPQLQQTILRIVQRHAPEVQTHHCKERPSKNGKYISITVTIEATSRAQLDAIYIDLNASDHVVMTL
ncbi:MAG: DUF493 domain-containing protein [Gammaproteobacteria bacterium]|nr:DUF493 domain-containing protein [Gammaproteobacteria bacterium]MDH5801966.1 DUF493 domain-containing protein [Gammaproteobacteria bacterium]